MRRRRGLRPECDIRRDDDQIVIRMEPEVAEFYAEALERYGNDDQGAAADARALLELAAAIRTDQTDDELPDDELPDMWEPADLSGGWADTAAYVTEYGTDGGREPIHDWSRPIPPGAGPAVPDKPPPAATHDLYGPRTGKLT